MNNFTRIEAICIAQNISDLAKKLLEQRGDVFPEDYYENVTQRAQSMQDYIIDNERYSHVTPKMTAWLTNTWNGLRRWDRDSMFNDDMLEGLENVKQWLYNKKEEKDNVPNTSNNRDDRINSTTVANSNQNSELCNNGDNGRQRGTNNEKERDEEKIVWNKLLRNIGLIAQKQIDLVITTAERKRIKLIKDTDIKYGKLVKLLSLTKAPRTTELIEAAYFMGIIAGINDITAVIDKLIHDTKNDT